MFSNIRVISFDLDDTLWPCRPVIQRAEALLYKWLAEHAPAIPADYSIEAMREHRLAYVREHPEVAYDLTKVRQGSLQQLMDIYAYPEWLASQGTMLFREARNKVMPYPDVLPVLAGLYSRYQLVAVTNGNAEINKTPLSEYFHRSFTAAEVGAARPDPALFQAVLEWSGVVPEVVLHVGDDQFMDVESARSLGMRTVWMQRGHRQWPSVDAVADAVIKDLHQLANLLTKENR